MSKEWKTWQSIYNSLVTDHSDAGHKHKRYMAPKTVDNALFYIREKSDVGIYPAKSYMVAIIYAHMLAKVYKEDFYEVLDDPDLLFGQDEFFVPYSQDKEFYDQIIAKLEELNEMETNWIRSGWAPKTVEYFYLECTEAGVESINGKLTSVNPS